MTGVQTCALPILRNALHSQVLTGQLTTKIVTKVQILNYFQSCAAARFDILLASLNSQSVKGCSVLALNTTVFAWVPKQVPTTLWWCIA